MNNLYRLLLAILILSSVNISKASAQTACFTAVDTACIDLASFAFTNCSSGALSYLWDFGDGFGTSTLTNPSYDYFTQDREHTPFPSVPAMAPIKLEIVML